MKYFTVFICLLISNNLIAQTNLVINPSFEIVSSIPLQNGELNKCIGWKSPNVNLPDIYSILSPQPYVSVPLGNQGFFYQNPRTGNNYAGILVFRKNFIPNSRYYIIGKLSDTLQKKEKYSIEFYTNLANNSVYSVNNLGVYFSNDTIYNSSPNSLLDTPQVVNMASNPLNDTLNWIKVTGTYTAKGGEKYLTIGCFSAALGLDTLRISTCTFCDEAYYFIDDVSVTLIDSANGIGELEAASKIKVWPNPAKEQFIISNELPSTTAAVVELYSIIGTLGIMDKINGQNL